MTPSSPKTPAPSAQASTADFVLPQDLRAVLDRFNWSEPTADGHVPVDREALCWVVRELSQDEVARPYVRPILALWDEWGRHPAAGADPSSPFDIRVMARHLTLHLVDRLLAAGLSVDARARPRFASPLVFALKAADNTVARHLLDRGASVVVPGSNLDPLTVAIQENNGEGVLLLLGRGAAPLVRPRRHETLAWAHFKDGFIPDLLLSAGATIDNDGKVLRRALETGVDPVRLQRLMAQAPALEGPTVDASRPPLLHVAAHHHPKALPVLLAAGLDPNARDHTGVPVLPHLVETSLGLWTRHGAAVSPGSVLLMDPTSDSFRTLLARVGQLLTAGADTRAALDWLTERTQPAASALPPELSEPVRDLLDRVRTRLESHALNGELAAAAAPCARLRL